jgi:PPOX class probable F420-dependent enzyme
MLDLTTERGLAAQRRLETELVVWLTTVTPAGQPQSSPVWFLWRDGELLVYSLLDTPRVRNIEANPKVALHLVGDAEASDVLSIEGEARIDRAAAGPDSVPELMAKYRPLDEPGVWTVEDYARGYPLAIHIRPVRFRFG